jgi:hypothetical protein
MLSHNLSHIQVQQNLRGRGFTFQLGGFSLAMLSKE